MNTSPTESPSPSILIVEDEPGTVRNLTSKLEAAIPDADVESAETVMDGQNLLNIAYDHHRPYDVAILDFKLPKDKGSPTEEGDYSLAFLRDLCPDTLIIHITAWPGDPNFRRVCPAPNTPPEAHRICFGKNEFEWAQKVAAACAKHIIEKRVRFHTDRIRAMFQQLFGRPDDSERSTRSTGRARSGRGDRAQSLDIAILCDDAGRHWNDLDEALQKELGDVLGHVQDKDGRHYVGVVAEYMPTPVEEKKETP